LMATVDSSDMVVVAELGVPLSLSSAYEPLREEIALR
jgi:hypothetical protein